MADDPPEPYEEEYEIDEPFKKFFSAVGYAITRWAYVDAALFELCHFALGDTSKEKTAAIFYRSTQLGDHLKLTDKLMKLSLPEALITQWEAIYKAADKQIPTRNHLAHEPPIQVLSIHVVMGKEPHFPQPPPDQWWEIATQDTKLIHKKDRDGNPAKKVATKLEQIVAHIHATEDILKAMWSFQKMLPAHPEGQRPKSLAPKSPHASVKGRRRGDGDAKR